MAVSETTPPMTIDTDATFRAWVTAVHDALIAAGLVQTADTGQINRATVLLPAVGAYGGYEVFSFNDEGATAVFVKVNFGRGSGFRPGLEWTVGRGSDGAGTLTTATGILTHQPGGDPDPGTLLHVALLNGVFSFVSIANTVDGFHRMVFTIERLRHCDGTLSADLAIISQTSTTIAEAYVLRAGAWAYTIPTDDRGSLSLADRLVAGAYRFDESGYDRCRALLFTRAAVLAAGDTGEISVHGLARPYKRVNVGTLAFTLAGAQHDLLVRTA